jgi:hypothetical protein
MEDTTCRYSAQKYPVRMEVSFTFRIGVSRENIVTFSEIQFARQLCLALSNQS